MKFPKVVFLLLRAMKSLGASNLLFPPVIQIFCLHVEKLVLIQTSFCFKRKSILNIQWNWDSSEKDTQIN